MRSYNKTHDHLTQACAYIGSMLPKKINGFTPVITLEYNEFELAWNLTLSVKERDWSQHLAQVGQEANGGIAVTSEIPRETMRRVEQIFKIKHNEILNASEPWYEKLYRKGRVTPAVDLTKGGQYGLNHGELKEHTKPSNILDTNK